MNCQFPYDAMAIAITHLRRSGMTISKAGDSYRIVEGILNLNVVNEAVRDRAITIAEDGSIQICEAYVPTGWDIVRIRRKVEDHLRKSASTEEIIRIASCLGVTLISSDREIAKSDFSVPGI